MKIEMHRIPYPKDVSGYGNWINVMFNKHSKPHNWMDIPRSNKRFYEIDYQVALWLFGKHDATLKNEYTYRLYSFRVSLISDNSVTSDILLYSYSKRSHAGTSMDMKGTTRNKSILAPLVIEHLHNMVDNLISKKL